MIVIGLWIAFSITTVLFIGFMLWGTADDWNSGTIMTGAILTGCLALILLIAAPVVNAEWVSARNEARLMNEAWGTEYTTEDVFWGGSVIYRLEPGTKSRIEVELNDNRK